MPDSPDLPRNAAVTGVAHTTADPAAGLPGYAWRKSTASNHTGNCVELAELPDGGVAVRNSRHPAGPTLVYTRAEIAAFIRGVHAGEFDDLAS